MPLVATLFNVPTDERRGAERRPVERDTTLRASDGQPRDVLIRDLSGDGFLVETDVLLAEGDVVRIGLPGIGTREARIVRSPQANLYGCSFLVPLDQATAARAFEVEALVAGQFPSLPAPEFPEPHVEPWSRRTRMLVLIGATSAAWTAIALCLA